MDRIEEYRQEMAHFNQRLQEQVEVRTRQLRDALGELRKAKEEVERTRVEIIERLGVAAEYRDHETGVHIRRMSKAVYEIALAYGIPQETSELYRLAAPMHDIGKMGVQDHVLLKPAQLEEGEIELIRQHTIIGFEILGNPSTELLRVARQMARSHHERWDGKGYPDGLKGEDIPLPARICAVADVFDALHYHRIYRDALASSQDAYAAVVEGAGTLFDPKVVEAFKKIHPKLVANGDKQ
jgi:putative two-component system response regulator